MQIKLPPNLREFYETVGNASCNLWKADNEPNIDPKDVSLPSGAILNAASRGGPDTLDRPRYS
jgi:hypothetical protein